MCQCVLLKYQNIYTRSCLNLWIESLDEKVYFLCIEKYDNTRITEIKTYIIIFKSIKIKYKRN